MPSLYIEVTSGEYSGTSHEAWPGVRLGRSLGELVVADPKMSSLHAQVEKDGQGNLVLVDRGSMNGIRLEGKKVSRMALFPGVQFQLGRTQFRVVAKTKDSEVTDASSKWISTLQTGIDSLIMKDNPLSGVLAFSPLLRLTFREGPQADESLLLGYGPREFSNGGFDLDLAEPLGSGILFSIHPTANGSAIFRREQGLVMINGETTPEKKLESGDSIRVGQTLIGVSFEPN